MYYAFIDQSGALDPKEPDQWIPLASVTIRDDHIKEVTQRLYKIEIDCFGEEAPGQVRKLKGKKLIDDRSVTEKYRLRKCYVDRVIELLAMYDFGVFAVVMERPDYVPHYTPHTLPTPYALLVQRLHYWGSANKQDVLVIFDRTDEASGDSSLAMGFKNYLFRHDMGKTFNRIVELPLFVPSDATLFIRFPDIVGNIFREYHNLDLNNRSSENDFEKWLCELYEKISKRTTNYPYKYNGKSQTAFGIYVMAKNKFPPKK